MRTVEGQHTLPIMLRYCPTRSGLAGMGSASCAAAKPVNRPPSLIVDAAGVVRAGGGEVALELGVDLRQGDDGVHDYSLRCSHRKYKPKKTLVNGSFMLYVYGINGKESPMEDAEKLVLITARITERQRELLIQEAKSEDRDMSKQVRAILRDRYDG